MTPVAAWVLVALAAVLVGAVVPVLIRLYRTLSVLEETLESTGRHLNETLERLTITLERVNRAADEFERRVDRVSSLLDALNGIGDAIARFRSSLGTVASLGSILGGALLAAFGLKSRDSGKEAERREPIESGGAGGGNEG